MTKKRNNYVYVHRSAADNKIFYVGKGTKDRAYSTTGRNAAWKNKVLGGYTIEIIPVKTEEDAYELEQFILDFAWDQLVNVKKISDERHDYAAIDWKSIIYYDETSPTCLRYLEDNNCKNPRYKKLANDPAGYLRKVNNKLLHGQIEVQGKSFAIHRVVWLLHYKSVGKELLVDHIDNDPTNNKISNLRLVSITGNTNNQTKRNTGKSNLSSTGYANIGLKQYKGKRKMYLGITVNGVKTSKQMCISTLGYAHCLEELIKLRDLALGELKFHS